MGREDWDTTRAISVAAVLIGATELWTGPQSVSASSLLAGGLLALACGYARLADERRERAEEFKRVTDSVASPVEEIAETGPIIEQRSLAQQVADHVRLLQRARGALANPNISDEKRAAADRVRRGAEMLLCGKLAAVGISAEPMERGSHKEGAGAP